MRWLQAHLQVLEKPLMIKNWTFTFCLAIKTAFSLPLAGIFIYNALHADLQASHETIESEQHSLQISYSQLADKFHWLDQVSDSTLSFFQLPDYRSASEACWNLNENDLSYFDHYRMIRKKYQNENVIEESLFNCLFAPDPATVIDPIADAFYSSCSFKDVLAKLLTKLSSEELLFLEQFFLHFESRLDKMILLHRKDLSNTLEMLNAYLSTSEVQEHLQVMQKFYNARPESIKSVLLFSAPEKHISGASYGHHLHLRIPSTFIPSSNEHTDLLLSSILVHEATHHISGCTSIKQKELFSRTFLETCGELKGIPLLALEEPLIVATQMYFIKTYHPDGYNTAQSWFLFPLAKQYFTILEAYLSKGRSIDMDFIENCGKAYYYQANSNE